jgi:hypothetical protein
MTVVLFDDARGDTEQQATACFRRLRDFVQEKGLHIDAAPYLIVEVCRRDSLPAVMRARWAVFGDRRPRTVSTRVARLPAGQLVRVTAELD